LTIAHIERQPAQFQIEWEFSGPRNVIEKSTVDAIVANRKLLLRLIDAASKGSRDDILAGLRQESVPVVVEM
jgi:hypothetical protein